MEAAANVSRLWHTLVYSHFWSNRLTRWQLRHNTRDPRHVVCANRSSSICRETSISLEHIVKVVDYGEGVGG